MLLGHRTAADIWLTTSPHPDLSRLDHLELFVGERVSGGLAALITVLLYLQGHHFSVFSKLVLLRL